MTVEVQALTPDEERFRVWFTDQRKATLYTHVSARFSEPERLISFELVGAYYNGRLCFDVDESARRISNVAMESGATTAATDAGPLQRIDVFGDRHRAEMFSMAAPYWEAICNFLTESGHRFGLSPRLAELTRQGLSEARERCTPPMKAPSASLLSV